MGVCASWRDNPECEQQSKMSPPCTPSKPDALRQLTELPCASSAHLRSGRHSDGITQYTQSA